MYVWVTNRFAVNWLCFKQRIKGIAVGYKMRNQHKAERRKASELESMFDRWEPRVEIEPGGECNECIDGVRADDKRCPCPDGLRKWLTMHFSDGEGQ